MSATDNRWEDVQASFRASDPATDEERAARKAAYRAEAMARIAAYAARSADSTTDDI